MLISTKVKNPQLKLLIQILKRIFKHPILATVEGDWKTGKTDFALFVSEVLLENNIVYEVASNIHTEGFYPQISDIRNLRSWLHRNKKKKLYIFDELNENLPSRRPMSNKNVNIISILPECSKARARIIGLAQDLSGIDKTFRKKVWSKAFFRKFRTKSSAVKNLQVFSSMLRHRYEFYNIPRTTVKFNPYLLAPFTERPSVPDSFNDADLDKFANWVNGIPWKDNGFKHPQEANRFYIRVGKRLLSTYSQLTDNSVEGIITKKE